MERRVFDDRDVGDRSAAPDRSFEQVVAEDPVLGKAAAEHGVHRLHVEQPLAGVGAFPEHVLVDLGARRAVRVDSGLAREQPVVERDLVGLGQRRRDVRLQDRVAALDALAVGRELRQVVRMRGDADELAQAARRQARVAVEGDDVARSRRDGRGAAEIEERAGAALGEQGEQLLELAALSLPADPLLLGRREASLAMEDDEARRLVRRRGVEGIQPLDLGDRRAEQRGVARLGLAFAVRPVRDERELRMSLGVGEIVQLEVVGELAAALGRGQHRRNRDHRPVLGRDAAGQAEAGQAHRPGRFADQAVDDRDDRFRCREDHQQRGERGEPGRRLSGREGRAVPHQHPGDQGQRHRTDGAEVRGQGSLLEAPMPGERAVVGHAEGAAQLAAAGAAQPVVGDGACVDVAAVRRRFRAAHQAEQRRRDLALALPALPRQQLDRVQRLVARVVAFAGERRRAEHLARQHAGGCDDVGPVGVADRPQRRDRVADAQVVGRLRRGQPDLDLGEVRRDAVEPLEVARVRRRAVVLQLLRHLGEERLADRALVEQRQDRVELVEVVGFDPVAAQVGDLARGLVGRRALGEPAQVLEQDDAQRRRQRPQLAEGELADLLVGTQEVNEQIVVEGAVGVGDEGPGDAVDARQADQRLVLEDREVAKVAARQPVPDLARLRFDQVEVVEQPFGGRADLVARRRVAGDVVLRLAQDADVLAQAREEGARTLRCERRRVRLCEAAAVLRKALGPEDLGAVRPLERAAPGVEDLAQLGRRVGHQPQQVGRSHPAVKRPARPPRRRGRR